MKKEINETRFFLHFKTKLLSSYAKSLADLFLIQYELLIIKRLSNQIGLELYYEILLYCLNLLEASVP